MSSVSIEKFIHDKPKIFGFINFFNILTAYLEFKVFNFVMFCGLKLILSCFSQRLLCSGVDFPIAH